MAPRLFQFIAMILFTAAQSPLFSAEPQLPPSKRNAPKGQKIEFSTSTSPQLPVPTARSEQLQNRTFAPESKAGPALSPGDGAVGPVAQPQMSKALAERMLQQLDRKKNWLVPGAQEAELGSVMGDWMSKGFEQSDANGERKNESVMERFLKGDDGKARSSNNRRPDPSTSPFDDRKPDNEGSANLSLFDPKNNAPSEGISDFSLQGVLSSGMRTDFGRNEISAAAGFRSEYGQDPNRIMRDREIAREREAVRSAEFQKLIEPRGSGPLFGVIPDPINSAPDLTRRDLNPVLPRSSEPASSSFQTPFGGPQTSGFRAGDRSMLGVTTPATPNFTPATAPSPAPSVTPGYKPSMSIILEPPRRPF